MELTREMAEFVVYYGHQGEKAVEVARGTETLGPRSLVVKAGISNEKEFFAMRDMVIA